MSRPSQPAGIASTVATRASASAAKALAATTSVGSSTGYESGLCVPHLLGHLAADEHAVGPSAEVLEHGQLVLDLGAARDEDEGLLDLPEQAAEMLQLGEQEQPRIRRQQVGDGLGRGVRAVRGAERIVDVEVVPVRELAREGRVVLRLARVEAGVLEHAQASVGNELAQAALDRRHRVRRPVLLRLRPPEMGADADPGRAAVEQQPQGRQRGPDARVVCDLAVLERDVQVGADQDAASLDLRRARRSAAASSREELAAPGPRAGSCSPTRCRTSRRPWRCAPCAIVSSLSKMHE